MTAVGVYFGYEKRPLQFPERLMWGCECKVEITLM